jgi:hypothetical protein
VVQATPPGGSGILLLWQRDFVARRKIQKIFTEENESSIGIEESHVFPLSIRAKRCFRGGWGGGGGTRNEPQKEKRNVCKRCICICRTQYIIAKSIFFFSHTWVFHVIKLSCHQTRRCRIRSSADCETRFTYVVSFCIGMKYYFNVYACVSSLNKYSARIIQLIHGQSVSSIRTTALPGRHSRWRETKRVLCVQRVRLFTGC